MPRKPREPGILRMTARSDVRHVRASQKRPGETPVCCASCRGQEPASGGPRQCLLKCTWSEGS